MYSQLSSQILVVLGLLTICAVTVSLMKVRTATADYQTYSLIMAPVWMTFAVMALRVPLCLMHSAGEE